MSNGGGGSGGGGGVGLSKLGIALTIIFVISLLALFAQLFYALWRRRVFRRQTNRIAGGEDRLSIYSSSDSSFSSKELLYFFCIRRQSQLQSNSATASSSNNHPNSSRQLEMESVDIDLFKIQGMFGPPRFLFTIKEEEKEDLESPADKSLHSGDKLGKKFNDENKTSRVSLEECFKAEELVVEVEIDGGGGGGGQDATPFSTPCASPSYFTPSTSPAQEVVNRITEESRTCSEIRTTPLVMSEV